MGTDATRCAKCGGEFSAKRIHIDGDQFHPGCAIMSSPPHTHEDLARLSDVLGWVESWVSNPVGSYSVHALDGLFAMTRDKIAALRQPH